MQSLGEKMGIVLTSQPEWRKETTEGWPSQISVWPFPQRTMMAEREGFCRQKRRCSQLQAFAGQSRHRLGETWLSPRTILEQMMRPSSETCRYSQVYFRMMNPLWR